VDKNKLNYEEPKTRRGVKATQKKNKGKHKKKIIRAAIYISLVVFVLSLLFLIGFGIYKLSTSSKYNLVNIIFEGNEEYSYEELRETIGIEDGTNLFRLSKSKVIDNLNQLPYIDKVKISKKYPDSLVIKITEYEPYYFAYNKETNKYVKLTRNGVILEECEQEAREDDELIIFGISFDDTLGKEIGELENKKLTNYMYIKEIYDNSGIAKEITSVEFKEGDIILTLNHDINVVMSMDEIEYKLNFLKNILDEIPGKAGTIDMTVDSPIFRETLK